VRSEEARSRVSIATLRAETVAHSQDAASFCACICRDDRTFFFFFPTLLSPPILELAEKRISSFPLLRFCLPHFGRSLLCCLAVTLRSYVGGAQSVSARVDGVWGGLVLNLDLKSESILQKRFFVDL